MFISCLQELVLGLIEVHSLSLPIVLQKTILLLSAKVSHLLKLSSLLDSCFSVLHELTHGVLFFDTPLLSESCGLWKISVRVLNLIVRKGSLGIKYHANLFITW